MTAQLFVQEKLDRTSWSMRRRFIMNGIMIITLSLAVLTRSSCNCFCKLTMATSLAASCSFRVLRSARSAYTRTSTRVSLACVVVCSCRFIAAKRLSLDTAVLHGFSEYKA